MKVKDSLDDLLAHVMWDWWNKHERTMYECDACGRLIVQITPEQIGYASYMPESNVRGILRSRGGEASSEAK